MTADVHGPSKLGSKRKSISKAGLIAACAINTFSIQYGKPRANVSKLIFLGCIEKLSQSANSATLKRHWVLLFE